MRVRLVQISLRPSGKLARREEVLDCTELRIGRGTGNELQLSGLALGQNHARVEQHLDGCYIQPLDRNSVLVNGKRIEGDVPLTPGDTARLASFEVRVVEPSGDEDLALEVEQVVREQDALAELEQRTQLGIERGMSSRRLWSWLAVLAVVVGCLLVPLFTPWKSSWSSGEISRKHANIADNCEACHSAFTAAPDQKCLTCHFDVESHAAATIRLAGLDDTRCASCHLEHDGPQGLAALEDELCVSCHEGLSGQLEDVRVGDASDFAANHPEFKMYLLEAGERPLPGESYARTAVAQEWSLELRETSGVRYDHHLHVVAILDKWSPGDAETLCDSCHELDAGEALG